MKGAVIFWENNCIVMTQKNGMLLEADVILGEKIYFHIYKNVETNITSLPGK